MRKPIRLTYLYVLEKLFNFLGQYPKIIITDYDEALVQAVKRLHVRCKIDDALKYHIQMPNSFITNSFQQKSHHQFLSALSSDLENALRDSDHKSHQAKVNKLMEAC